MKANIRAIRRSKGLSVKALARMVGVSAMSIYRYETGHRIPDVDVAAKIADNLGVTIEELIEKKAG